MESKKKFDLEERTTQFGKNIVRFCRSLKQDPINSRICGQLVGSAGSIGANYREANDSLGRRILFIASRFLEKKLKKQFIGWN